MKPIVPQRNFKREVSVIHGRVVHLERLLLRSWLWLGALFLLLRHKPTPQGVEMSRKQLSLALLCSKKF